MYLSEKHHALTNVRAFCIVREDVLLPRMATFSASTCICPWEEKIMTQLFALVQLEELRILPGHRPGIEAALRGDDSESPFTARVTVWRHRTSEPEFLLLRFASGELHRRFGRFSWREQDELAQALYDWANSISSSNSRTRGGSEPHMEVEIPWSVNRRRRVQVCLEHEELRAGQQQPFRNRILHLRMV